MPLQLTWAHSDTISLCVLVWAAVAVFESSELCHIAPAKIWCNALCALRAARTDVCARALARYLMLSHCVPRPRSQGGMFKGLPEGVRHAGPIECQWKAVGRDLVTPSGAF